MVDKLELLEKRFIKTVTINNEEYDYYEYDVSKTSTTMSSYLERDGKRDIITIKEIPSTNSYKFMYIHKGLDLSIKEFLDAILGDLDYTYAIMHGYCGGHGYNIFCIGDINFG